MWRVRVSDGCIGSGTCVALASHRFASGKGNHAYPIAEEIEPDDRVLDAVASCPMEAISVVNLDTGEPVEP
jgi:ferredoxin